MQRRDVRSSSARTLAWLLVAPFAFVECSCSAEDAMVSRLCQSAIALYGAWPSPAQRSSRIPTRYTWVHMHVQVAHICARLLPTLRTHTTVVADACLQILADVFATAS